MAEPPFCKNHCDCAGHDRRRDRPGGSKRGRRNPAPAALRSNVQEQYRTLAEILEWLETGDAGEMVAAGLHSDSAVRKALVNEAMLIATQGWATDPSDMSPWAVLLEAIPAHMTSRLYQDVKQSLRRQGMRVYDFQTPRPGPAQGGHGTSSSSSSHFLPPPPPPHPASRVSASSQRGMTAAPLHLPPSAPLERQRTPADASGGELRPTTTPLVLADVSEELRMEDMTQRLVEACRTSLQNITIRSPAGTSALPELQFIPGGSWPWNDVKNHVTSHIGRVGALDRTIHLQRGKPSSLAAAAAADLCLGRRSLPTATDEILVLQHWIDARPGLRGRIARISVAEHPPYSINGIWLQIDLVHSPRTQASGPWEMRVGWHGTAMASLYRCIMRGPESGWAGKFHSGDPRLGIYMHCDPRADLTSSYMLHSPLRRSGWLWSPLLELHWPCPDPSNRPHVGRRSKDSSQFITYPDVVTMPRVYLHLSHVAMWSTGERSQWLSVEPRFPTECEVDPSMETEALYSRSEQRFRSTMAANAATQPVD